jgi:hypothetical protein
VEQFRARFPDVTFEKPHWVVDWDTPIVYLESPSVIGFVAKNAIAFCRNPGDPPEPPDAWQPFPTVLGEDGLPRAENPRDIRPIVLELDWDTKRVRCPPAGTLPHLSFVRSRSQAAESGGWDVWDLREEGFGRSLVVAGKRCSRKAFGATGDIPVCERVSFTIDIERSALSLWARGPEHPEDAIDIDKDGKLEFLRTGFRFAGATPGEPAWAGPYRHVQIDVALLEAWDGEKFIVNHPRLLRPYSLWLSRGVEATIALQNLYSRHEEFPCSSRRLKDFAEDVVWNAIDGRADPHEDAPLTKPPHVYGVLDDCSPRDPESDPDGTRLRDRFLRELTAAFWRIPAIPKRNR